MSRSRTRACRRCVERLQETNEVYEVADILDGGVCVWCNKWYPVLTIYEFENRDTAERRRKREQQKARGYAPEKDRRPRYKEPFRNW